MEHTNWKYPLTGRWYAVLEDGDARMVIGPPEELVDRLELPEPFATHLHNILHRRGIFTYQDATRKHQELAGALQEALNLDAQRLHEQYYHLQKEEVLP